MINKKLLKGFKTSIQEMEKLNPIINVRLTLRYPDYNIFLKYKPRKRNQKITEKLNKNFESLKTSLGGIGVKLETNGRPIGLRLKLAYEELKDLSVNDYVDTVVVEEIEGIKKVTVKSKKKKMYISVKAQISIKVEGFKRGKQLYEHRIVLVYAKSTKSAEKKVQRNLEKNSKPYLNAEGRLVKWEFDKILDSYETGVLKLNELRNKAGIEIFSKLKSRKIKPEYIYEKQWG